jgi:prepilin-type processing-associated H-X9-DG protein
VFHLYSSDWEGVIPAPYATIPSGQTRWWEMLLAATPDFEWTGTQCPDRKVKKKPSLNTPGFGVGWANGGSSASLEWNTGNNGWKGNSISRHRSTTTFLLAERWAFNGPSGGDDNWNTDAPYLTAPVTSDSTATTPAALRLSHRGRSNYLFLDGHIACIGPAELCSPANTAVGNSLNSPNAWRDVP